ncbi:response regulator [Nocardioides nematodiphilus]|uniref:response regulator n=1 Tax=Nocardioides nematodiphilus TaxID=2849669 RepID=UPI001CD9A41D|nr:response regulator transcription factor [Nocardioides nematodiphilus]MCA1982261.1 response regulator transcription factor [Nocardioides nematodiphilus]
MSERTRIRVYLLDDHELIRRGIKDLLEESGEIVVVGESGLAQEAAAQIPALKPDVAILDGRLPDGSGIDVCRDVRSEDPEIRALILTSYDDDDALFSAIMAGASGYVLKQVRSNDLVETVRQVHAGHSMLDPVITAKVLDRIRSGDFVAAGAGGGEPGLDVEAAHLTPHEQRILTLIGEGMTNRQIARQTNLAEKTIKNYVSSLLAKLGVESRTQAAILVTRNTR